MSFLGNLALSVAGPLIGGIFGKKASDTAAEASTAAAAMQIQAAKDMQAKELEAVREAMDMMKESEDNAINIMVDSMLNQFRLGKSDYLMGEEAKAGLRALTYGKPQEYISNIWTTAQSRGATIPAEVQTEVTERTEIAPPRTDVAPTPTPTPTAAKPTGISNERMSYLQNMVSKVQGLRTGRVDNVGKPARSTPPIMGVSKTGDRVYVHASATGSGQKPVTFDMSVDEAKAIGLDPTGRQMTTMHGQVISDAFNIPVEQLDEIWTGYLDKRAQDAAADTTVPTYTEPTPTTPVTEDEVVRAQQREVEGYRGSVLPAVETDTADMTPESLVSPIYDSPIYKRRIRETEAALTGVMGRDIYSSAGQKLFLNEIDKINIEEENRLWSKLSQLAGYGTYLPESVSSTATSISGTTEQGGVRRGQSVIGGAQSASDLITGATRSAGGYISDAGRAKAEGIRSIGSAIGYGFEDYLRTKSLQSAFGGTPAGGSGGYPTGISAGAALAQGF